VPVFEGEKIIRVEEKPANPASNYAVIGIYMYDYRVFEFIRSLKPSERGELEITDVNNFYIREEKKKWDVLDGWWSDARTFESLQSAGNMVAKTGANKI
jgi:glucose-1-phosphate thymidylyltransferase